MRWGAPPHGQSHVGTQKPNTHRAFAWETSSVPRALVVSWYVCDPPPVRATHSHSWNTTVSWLPLMALKDASRRAIPIKKRAHSPPADAAMRVRVCLLRVTDVVFRWREHYN